MWILRTHRRKRLLQRHLIDAESWAETLQALPLLDGLSARQSHRLRELATLFLHEKAWEPVAGFDLTRPMRLAIAAQASLPILELGLDWYQGWKAVIVYPGQFVSKREEIDHIGVMHQFDEVRSGESWGRGPVILSWADVEASGQAQDGYNVVIHEMAHKLDMLNGDANGFPPLHRGMDPRAWTAAFQAAFDDLNHRIDRHLHTPIDPYAATDPGECFAVFSEYFFEWPERVRDTYPLVYRELRAFYRQDPAARLLAGVGD